MSQRFFVACALMALVVAGCSGALNQDPLSGKSEVIKNGENPAEKPERPKPVASDSVRLFAPQHVSLMEDREDTIVFNMHVLVPDHTSSMEVLHLDAFPGAKFVAATGVFTWTPKKGTVTSGNYREMELNVNGIAEPADQTLPALLNSTSVHIVVNRKIEIPEVISVTGSNSNYREGSVETVTVVVHDPDGGQDPAEAPNLLILPPSAKNYGEKSLAPFTSITSVVADWPNRKWTYRLRVDLVNEEVTTSAVSAGFRVRTINRFNQPSADAPFHAKVFTQLSTLYTTWVSEVQVFPAQENTIPFLIYDQKGEALIDVTTTSKLPAGASLKCTSARQGVGSCVFKWTPPYNEHEETLELGIRAKGSNQDSSDTEVVNTRMSLPLRVRYLPAPTPTPTPTPDPTPTPPSPISRGF